jgi:glycosyltransferase involved in cell wall biosynthesis
MRVLMLGWEFPPHISGGLGTACAGLVAGLCAQRVDVLFVVPRLHGGEDAGDATLVAADDGAEAATVAVETVPSALLPYQTATTYRRRRRALTGTYGGSLFEEVARYAQAVRDVADRERCDVVHGHDWMTYPAAIAAARDADVPLVLHVHALEHDRSGKRSDPRIVEIEQQGFDAADAIVCVSRYTAAEVTARYRVDRRKLRVVHNAGPSWQDTAPRRGPRRIEEPVVLFLGRVTSQKGPFVFLDAAARVVAVEPRVKFVVAGTGDMWPALVERAARLRLARHVHFTGFLRADDVERAYAEADVYVLPSVSEPFGITPLEAAVRGVPVIVSRRSGVSEVLTSALVVDSWDVEALADRILALLRRPALVRELVRQGREQARRLTWHGQAGLLREVYESLLR